VVVDDLHVVGITILPPKADPRYQNSAFGCPKRLVLNIQATLSLIAFALIARWHVAPRLAALSREDALLPLLWVNVFRYAPLTLFAPDQVDPGIPGDVVATIAYGDFVSALLALAALCATKLRVQSAIVLVWLFTAVGIADLIVATAKAIGSEMYKFYMGWNWYIVGLLRGDVGGNSGDDPPAAASQVERVRGPARPREFSAGEVSRQERKVLARLGLGRHAKSAQ
jgi:hypothetical protein